MPRATPNAPVREAALADLPKVIEAHKAVYSGLAEEAHLTRGERRLLSHQGVFPQRQPPSGAVARTLVTDSTTRAGRAPSKAGTSSDSSFGCPGRGGPPERVTPPSAGTAAAGTWTDPARADLRGASIPSWPR